MKARTSSFLLMLAILFAGISFPAYAAQGRPSAPAGIQIARITGTIRIVTPDNKIITVSRGDRLPSIPSGSKVMVVSGRAQIEAGSTRMVLGEKQALIISLDGITKAVHLMVAEGSTGIIRVRAGSSIVLLAKGNAITVTPEMKKNKHDIKAEQGTVVVITPEGRKELAEGGQIAADTVRPRQEPAGVDTPAIPEPPQPKTEEASPSIP